MLRYILIAIFGYLFGSISSAVLLSKKIFHEDVRTMGSGNAGATNMARVFGMLPGILAFLCDAAKTAIATLLGLWLGGPEGLAVGGIACVVGHCWPVFFQMRGGKGVSVGAMIALMVDWRILLILVAAFFITFFLTRIVSVCSIVVAVILPVASILMKQPLPDCILAAATGLLVLFQHRSNIVRLLRGEEKKFSPKSAGK